MNISDEWVGGFVSGDGWCGPWACRVSGRIYTYPRITITQKNLEPLKAIADRYGLSVQIDEGGVSRISTTKRNFASKITPYLSEVKRSSLGDEFCGPRHSVGFDWFAGFYEADGTMLLRSNGRSDYRYPSISITQYYHREVLDTCAEILGEGRVTGPHKAYGEDRCFVFRINGKTALQIGQQLLDSNMLSAEKNERIQYCIDNSTLGRKKIGSLSSFDYSSIAAQKANGIKVSDIAKQFDISESRIYQILRLGKEGDA